MPSYKERYVIEQFTDGSFNLYCQNSNREFCGIQDEKELLHDLFREIKQTKEVRR